MLTWFWRSRRKYKTFTRKTTTDNAHILIRKTHLISLFRWAKAFITRDLCVVVLTYFEHSFTKGAFSNLIRIDPFLLEKNIFSLNVLASSLSFPHRVWLLIAKNNIDFQKKPFVQCSVRNRTCRISRNFTKSKI